MKDMKEKTLSPEEDNKDKDGNTVEQNTDNEAAKSEKKDVTPDIPTVDCKCCDDYRRLMEGEHDNNSHEKHNPPPEDGLNLSGLNVVSDEEFIKMLNKASNIPLKSDIRNMYANGFAFSWGKMTVIAEYRGLEIDNPGKQNPHYVLNKSVENQQHKNADEDDGIIWLDKEKYKTKEVHWKIDERIVSEIDELLFGTTADRFDQSKIRNEIIRIGLNKVLELKEKGKLGIKKYIPVEKMWLMRPQEDDE